MLPGQCYEKETAGETENDRIASRMERLKLEAATGATASSPECLVSAVNPAKAATSTSHPRLIAFPPSLASQQRRGNEQRETAFDACSGREVNDD
jgi:hypothetical protein